TASNLVPGDTNGQRDIFVRDRLTGVTTRVSVSSSGAQANGGSGEVAMSADGNVIAFVSSASNLTADTDAAGDDVFVHDRRTGLTIKVSVSSTGVSGNSFSDQVAISADGRYVIFHSNATNLVPGGGTGIFVHDLLTGQTTRVSLASDGTPGNGASAHPTISA